MTRRDHPFHDEPCLTETACPGRDKWDAGSPLNNIVEELITHMGKDFAYLALARVAGFVGRFFPAATPADSQRIAIEILSALTPQERLVLASDDFQTIEPKAAAIIGRHSDLLQLGRSAVWIHERARDTPQIPNDSTDAPDRD